MQPDLDNPGDDDVLVPEWEPVPLELPVQDDHLRRPPVPAGGRPTPPADDAPAGSSVIEIDLA